MTKTKIEWADEVWNPVTGCTKVSEGCRHCYAERIAAWFWKDRKFSDVRLHEERLGEPLRWKKPRRVFVNSMSDLFHENVPIDFIANFFAVMALANQHTFMVLTKRAVRMLSILTGEEFAREYKECIKILTENSWTGVYEPLTNVWLGVSAETQKEADRRIPILLQTPAAVRFVSIEPMLGPVILADYLPQYDPRQHYARDPINERGKLDWVICGGESGPGARPMHPDWARGLRDVCQVTQVPFFFKQWGEWWPGWPQYGDTDDMVKFEDEAPNQEYEANNMICLENTGSHSMVIEDGRPRGYQPRPDRNPWWMLEVGKKTAGRELDGRTWEEYPGE